MLAYDLRVLIFDPSNLLKLKKQTSKPTRHRIYLSQAHFEVILGNLLKKRLHKKHIESLVKFPGNARILYLANLSGA